jgi:hypothetical protein
MKFPRFTIGESMTVVAMAALLAHILREIGRTALVP